MALDFPNKKKNTFEKLTCIFDLLLKRPFNCSTSQVCTGTLKLINMSQRHGTKSDCMDCLRGGICFWIIHMCSSILVRRYNANWWKSTQQGRCVALTAEGLLRDRRRDRTAKTAAAEADQCSLLARKHCSSHNPTWSHLRLNPPSPINNLIFETPCHTSGTVVWLSDFLKFYTFSAQWKRPLPTYCRVFTTPTKLRRRYRPRCSILHTSDPHLCACHSHPD